MKVATRHFSTDTGSVGQFSPHDRCDPCNRYFLAFCRAVSSRGFAFSANSLFGNSAEKKHTIFGSDIMSANGQKRDEFAITQKNSSTQQKKEEPLATTVSAKTFNVKKGGDHEMEALTASQKDKEETWDIPAFLRKKKR